MAITRRPRNNMLYGLGYNPSNGSVQVYLVSPSTGLAQSIGNGSPKFFATGTAQVDRVGIDANSRFSMDVNPSTDRIRVVVDNGDNFRVNPNTGALIDGNYGGATGSVSGTNKDQAINGLTSSVQSIAHTNTSIVTSNVTAYTVDAANDQLYIQAPQSNGNQTLPVALSPLIDSVFGFDIPFGVNTTSNDQPVTSGRGFIGITRNGAARLGVIDLVSGAISSTILPPSLGTPLSFSMTTNRAGSYPVMFLSNNGASLSRTSATALTTVSTVSITGVTSGEQLVGIDFRPANGQLMALGINESNDTGTLYLLDPQSGAASVVGTPGIITFTDAGGLPLNFTGPLKWGMDINPKTDRVRVVNSAGVNFRVNPTTGIPVDGDGATVGVNPDRPLQGANTTSDGVAFANNMVGANITTQYNLDSATSSLYIQSSPEGGVLEFAVPILDSAGAPLNATSAIGFDISNDVIVVAANQPTTSGKAITVITIGGIEQLCEIDLVTGRVSAVGATGLTGVVDLAVGYREVY